jgi:hypothetical protein
LVFSRRPPPKSPPGLGLTPPTPRRKPVAGTVPRPVPPPRGSPRLPARRRPWVHLAFGDTSRTLGSAFAAQALASRSQSHAGLLGPGVDTEKLRRGAVRKSSWRPAGSLAAARSPARLVVAASPEELVSICANGESSGCAAIRNSRQRARRLCGDSSICAGGIEENGTGRRGAGMCGAGPRAASVRPVAGWVQEGLEESLA